MHVGSAGARWHICALVIKSCFCMILGKLPSSLASTFSPLKWGWAYFLQHLPWIWGQTRKHRPRLQSSKLVLLPPNFITRVGVLASSSAFLGKNSYEGWTCTFPSFFLNKECSLSCQECSPQAPWLRAGSWCQDWIWISCNWLWDLRGAAQSVQACFLMVTLGADDGGTSHRVKRERGNTF